ncbi:MAG: hypothetical protein JW818_17635 [Pirellulales bacterium]|nr:hypothetical protein [Pirellulales bacterium]
MKQLGLTLGLMLLTGLAIGVRPARAETLDESLKAATTTHAAELEKLAGWCETEGLAAEAAKTRAWGKRQDATKLYIPILPKEVGPPKPPAGASPRAVQWQERFLALRQAQAERLYQLARRAAKEDRLSLALDLLMGSVREDPDNEPARRLLGYKAYRDQWHTPYEIRKLRKDYVWDDRFGWILKNHLKRYEQGERRFGSRWVSAEQDARARRDIHHGWDVETEHYSIRTNHSIEAGVALGQKLEKLYLVWTQLFYRYYATEQQIRSLFAGRAGRAGGARYNVVLFRDRDDYNRSLVSAYPNIAISVGVYSNDTHRAYFFAGKDSDTRNMYHEATHQLFQESRPVARSIGRTGNFWVMEGIALYMESLREEDGYYVLGGLNDDRTYEARYRLFHDKFYVPLSTLSAKGFREVQNDKHVTALYSQMAGLTHFLIHADEGRYRDALLAFISAVYNGNQDPGLLAQLTKTPYEELDRRYQAFLKSAGPVDLGEEPAADRQSR